MNIGICDDEENGRIYIQELIQRQNVFCKIIEFSSGEEVLQYQDQTEGESIDVLFLDISRGDSDGMYVAKQLRSRMEKKKEAVWGSLPLLIFVTGYPEYMQEAFTVNAFGYLVKPIRESDFENIFARAVREVHYIENKKQAEPKKILVRSGNTTRNISTDEIYYIESCNRKVILYLQHEKIEYYGKISELESELYPGFFRIHKGYLINLKYVERYNRTEVWMKNGDKLLLSKYKYQDFVKNYLEYL